MKVTEAQALQEKALTRKNGIYSFKQYLFVVKNNRFIGYWEATGNAYQMTGNFSVRVGTIKDKATAKQELRKLLK